MVSGRLTISQPAQERRRSDQPACALTVRSALAIGQALKVDAVELQGGSIIDPVLLAKLKKRGFQSKSIPIVQPLGNVGSQEVFFLPVRLRR